ncbi:MAG: EF-hand domain-containing protein [Gallionellaceae bacterium]
MNKIIGSIFVATCTLIASSVALACPPMQQGEGCNQHFTNMDNDKNGSISKKEFGAFHANKFKALDTNRDGKLSQDEMLEAHAFPAMPARGDKLIKRRFDAADIDHDGALNRDEAKAMPMLSNHFDDIDADKDGKVTDGEISDMMNNMRAPKEQPEQTASPAKN